MRAWTLAFAVLVLAAMPGGTAGAATEVAPVKPLAPAPAAAAAAGSVAPVPAVPSVPGPSVPELPVPGEPGLSAPSAPSVVSPPPGPKAGRIAPASETAAGWREPKPEEVAQVWRAEVPEGGLAVRGDFDGDGRGDVAKVLVNDLEGAVGVFVFLTTEGGGEPVRLFEIVDREAIDWLGIRPVEPGRHKTACGKGYYDCGLDEPSAVEIKRPAIDCFKADGFNILFYWDNLSGAFKRVLLTD